MSLSAVSHVFNSVINIFVTNLLEYVFTVNVHHNYYKDLKN